jgi:hypothetical protein
VHPGSFGQSATVKSVQGEGFPEHDGVVLSVQPAPALWRLRQVVLSSCEHGWAIVPEHDGIIVPS